MKNHIFRTIAVCFMLTFILSVAAPATAFAEDNELTINSVAKVKVGDKIKYTLNLSDTDIDIVGFELRIFYDHKFLELDKDAISYGKFEGVVHNLNIEDKIPITWTNVMSPASFSSKAEFLSMEFTALADGETEISQFVSEMYGMVGDDYDIVTLKSYKWTYDITVNDKPIVSDETPVISTDPDTVNNKQGGIINYLDGMGENNTPNKDDHQAVVGNTQVATQYVDVTRYESVSSDNSFNAMPIFVIAGAVVIIGAIVVILIIRKRYDDKINNEAEKIVEN